MEVSKKRIREWIEGIESLDCVFWACEGSAKNKVENMKTCRKCWIAYEMRQLLNKKPGDPES